MHRGLGSPSRPFLGRQTTSVPSSGKLPASPAQHPASSRQLTLPRGMSQCMSWTRIGRHSGLPSTVLLWPSTRIYTLHSPKKKTENIRSYNSMSLIKAAVSPNPSVPDRFGDARQYTLLIHCRRLRPCQPLCIYLPDIEKFPVPTIASTCRPLLPSARLSRLLGKMRGAVEDMEKKKNSV